MSTDKQRLKEIILEKSYRKGKFKLSSGLESDFYIDGKQLSYPATDKTQLEWICNSLSMSHEQLANNPHAKLVCDIVYDFYRHGFYYFAEDMD